MTTTRTPINRPPKRRITQAAIETFVAMEKLKCTCGLPRWKPDGPGQYTAGWGFVGGLWVQDLCRGCKKWARLHAILNDELRCRVWEWPCIPRPWEDEEGAHPDKVALYRELKEAAKAAAPARRRAKSPAP